MTCLKLLIDFLAKFEDTTGNGGKDAGAKLRTECANAISFEWSAERFEKAACTYHDDLTKSGSAARRTHPSLRLEEQLVLALGQGIRFHLRRFFNPMYFKVTVHPTWVTSR